MKIIKPTKLSAGDIIGIVAQSLPVLPSFQENYLKGKKVLEGLGFKIKRGETINKTKWWMAGDSKFVARDINDMFADKNVKAIIAQTGGYSAIGVLEYLDYQMISKNPKPYMGFSDMTAIHLALFEKCGMVGFHMDDVTFGFSRNSKEHKEMFRKFLMSTDAPGKIEQLSKWETWKRGSATGHLLGGNLHIMMAQSATPYFPSKEKWDGAILFFEEVGETLHDMARCLYELKYMGILDRINGLIIGKIKYVKAIRDTEVKEPTYKEMILEILKDYKFPILAEVDMGHFTVNIPMPLGIKVEVDATKKELKFLEGAVV